MYTAKEFERFGALFSKDQFFVSFLIDPTLHLKMEGNPIEDGLNENIGLKKYGEILQIGITFIILENPEPKHNNRWTYNTDSKDLSLQIQLKPTQIQKKSSEDLIIALAAYLLASFALLPKLKVPRFDFLSLLKDTTDLFQQKQWIKKTETLLNENELTYRWVFHFKGGPQFYFNKIVHPDAVTYLESEALGDLLELNIDLDQYGTGLRHIYFTILADDPEDKMEGALIDYNPDEKYIETTLPVSYPGLLLMNQQYNRSLLALLFLTSLKFYEKVGLGDFDVQTFHRDVKSLFWQEGWLDEKIVKK
jgi:hypothetical protein